MPVAPFWARNLMGPGIMMALATSSRNGEPNVAPMQQCWWFDDETLVVGDFFMKKTMLNILEMGQGIVLRVGAGPPGGLQVHGFSKIPYKGPGV